MSSDQDIFLHYDRAKLDRDTAVKIISALRQYKRRLRRFAHGAGNGSASEKLNRKRHSRRKVTALRKRILGGAPVRLGKEALLCQTMVANAILDGLYPERRSVWKKPLWRAPLGVTISLKRFSFVDDPIGTINSLRQIAEHEPVITEGQLNFDDEECLDVGPYLILQAMNKGMAPVFVGGKISRSVQSVLEAVGLKRALEMRFLPLSEEEKKTIYPLPFRTRYAQDRTKDRLIGVQYSEKTATDVIDKINEWLQRAADVELSRDGERYILQVIGEALDNAERHSDPIANNGDGAWSVAGFMTSNRRNGTNVYRCQLALLSAGATIAESLEAAAPTTKLKRDEYVRRHWRLLNNGFSEEALATVFALQDGVSRVPNRGGTGLMDIIGMFHMLSGHEAPDEPARMAIVSGATCILIAPPYIEGCRRGPCDDLHRAPRELWFNKDNTPEAEPDKSHVIQLPAKLQGTLISMAWTMDVSYLTRVANGNR